MRTSFFALALLATPTAASAQPLDVVASFSILADMVSTVGGAEVTVTSLVGPGEDAHVYEPTPADVVAVAGADLVVVNGLGFEGFLTRLIDASATGALVVEAARDVDVLEVGDDHDDHAHDDHGHDDHAHDDHAHDDHAHDDHAHDDHAHDDHAHDDHGHDGHDHGPIDPHAWQSLEAARAYVDAIAEGLCAVRAESCDLFEANAAAYSAQMEVLESQWRAAMAAIPEEERIVITSHDAFGYLARDFDLTVLAAQGVSTDSEASAADVARLIDQIRDTGARALFVETIADSRLLNQIAQETGLSVSGALYSDALAQEGEASSYLGMMDVNLRAITQALTASN